MSACFPCQRDKYCVYFSLAVTRPEPCTAVWKRTDLQVRGMHKSSQDLDAHATLCVLSCLDIYDFIKFNLTMLWQYVIIIGQVMTWHWTGEKPLPEPMMIKFCYVIWGHFAKICSHSHNKRKQNNIDGLVQDCSISIANALEILQYKSQSWGFVYGHRLITWHFWWFHADENSPGLEILSL